MARSSEALPPNSLRSSGPRIVSLLPAATEIVAVMGGMELLVGRSHECNHPPEVQSLPVCTASHLNTEGSSEEIHESVEERARKGLSLYEVLPDQLGRLRPDFILTQTQCEVCAVSVGEVERAIRDWSGVAPRIISLAPHRLEEVWHNILEVGDALGLEEEARAAVKALKNRLVDVIERSCVLRKRPRTVCVEWLEPLMVAGGWVPELVQLAGGEDLLGAAGKPSSWINPKVMVEREPEAVVLMPCGFDLERTMKEWREAKGKEPWRSLKAVRKGDVYLTDGNSYFNRPGPRLVESLEILAEILHPKLFVFGHKGRGWMRTG